MISKPIKVLWFSLGPSLAASYLKVNPIGNSWVPSLEAKIKENNNITLAVAFKHGKGGVDKFFHNRTTYYAIPDNASRLKKLVNRHLHNLNSEELLKSCLEIIQDFKPDIINIFGTEEGYGLISNKITIPVVIHLQGILTVYEKKWFVANVSKWDLIAHSSIRSLLNGYSLIHNYYLFKTARRREQQIFKTGNYFTGRTDWDKRITSVLAPNSKYYHCEEMLRPEFYSSMWSKQPQGEKIIISTIQANIYKGLETILESAILIKKLGKFDFKWLIVGISDDSIIIKIFEKKVGKKFKEFNIVFLGKVGAEELVDFELTADIFIHPSHIDNSPNSICEAMILGLPVIATYTGGTGSLLSDKKEGILIQDGDPHAMVGAILELVENPRYAAELGQNARQRALKRSDPTSIGNNIIHTYNDIIGKGLISVP